jgi:hypothetical protein
MGCCQVKQRPPFRHGRPRRQPRLHHKALSTLRNQRGGSFEPVARTILVRRHLKVHSYYGGPSRLHLNILRVRATRQYGAGMGGPQSRLLVCKLSTRIKTENGFSALSEIANGNRGRCRKVKLRRKMQEGGIAGDWSAL